MPMSVSGMADDIKNGLGFGAEPTSAETIGLTTSIITHIVSSAVVSHAIVSGIAPPTGGPLSLGAAAGGVIVGPNGAALASLMQVNMMKPSITSELQGMADSIANHIITGLVTFPTGSIIGTCGNTPVSPGPLVGSGAGGMIIGLDGTALANLMVSAMGKPGTTPELINFCTALVGHIMVNASVTYAPGAVAGVCSAGGGPVVATGAGGTIA